MKYGTNVYFNEKRGASFDGYKHGDPLALSRVVIFPEAESAEEAADQVFELLNRDDRPNAKVERSLSVGDVVKVLIPPKYEGGSGYSVWFACERVGWRPITQPPPRDG